MLDRVLATLTGSHRFRRLSTPLVRAFIRYAPLGAGKWPFWERVVDPYFAWHSHEFVASTVFGSKIAGNTRDIIPQYIYYFGVWEPYLTHWMSRRLSPNDIFIDVGANIGYFSLLASEIVGDSGAVVAIEASPETYGALRSNLARNRARNVRAVNVAASDRMGVVSLYRGPEHNTGMASLFEQQSPGLGVEVDAAPLSAILRPEEMHNARLIKVDVEGGEWSVVAGMEPLLSSGRTDLEVVIEVHPEPLARQGRRPEDLVEVFHKHGFNEYIMEEDFYLEAHMIKRDMKRPVRVRSPLQWEIDTELIFSRQDAELL